MISPSVIIFSQDSQIADNWSLLDIKQQSSFSFFLFHHFRGQPPPHHTSSSYRHSGGGGGGGGGGGRLEQLEVTLSSELYLAPEMMYASLDLPAMVNEATKDLEKCGH